MANRPNNIWAKAAAGSPGTNIARAQQSRWTGVSNEAIMRLVENKIGAMLEGISDATERTAAPNHICSRPKGDGPVGPPGPWARPLAGGGLYVCFACVTRI